MDKEALEKLTSRELLDAHRLERDDADSHWDALWVLRYRGGETEFDMGMRLVASEDAADRAIGADLLGQLGAGQPTYVPESVDALMRLLDDPDEDVVDEAIVNLGHRRDPRAVPGIVRFADHPSVDMRYSVACALGQLRHPLAEATLIRLSGDPDRDVRNWSVFGLGSLTETDTPEIRGVLVRALDEDDDEVRGEALVGLALRGDERTVPALLKEWRGGSYGTLSLEAAEEIGDPALLPRLNELLDELAGHEEEDFWRPRLDSAIAACLRGIEQRNRADGVR